MDHRNLRLNPVVRPGRIDAPELISSQTSENSATEVIKSEPENESSQLLYDTDANIVKDEKVSEVKVERLLHSELIIKEEPLESQFEEQEPVATLPTVQSIPECHEIKEERSDLDENLETGTGQSEISPVEVVTGCLNKKLEHEEIEKNMDSNGQSQILPEDELKLKKYNCDICASSFEDEYTFKQHECMQASTSGLESTSKISPSTSKHTCDVCGKSFSIRSNLKRHMVVHSDERLFKCTKCYKRFTSLYNLHRHQIIHVTENKFQCLLCDKSFKRKEYFQRHQQCHSRQNLFQCDTCKKFFRSKGYLRKHLMSHSDSRNFTCDVCQKSFVTEAKLQRHKIAHSDERTHKCEICHISFKRPSDLYSHYTFHGEKKFECDICQKKFFTKNSVKVHIKIHDSVRRALNFDI